MPQYLALAYTADVDWRAPSRRVSLPGTQFAVTDGPYAETKEALTG